MIGSAAIFILFLVVATKGLPTENIIDKNDEFEMENLKLQTHDISSKNAEMKDSSKKSEDEIFYSGDSDSMERENQECTPVVFSTKEPPKSCYKDVNFSVLVTK